MTEDDATAQLAELLAGDGQRLLADTRPDEDPLVASDRLRRAHPARLVPAALTQARLRARAVEKFGADAAAMYFTPDGLEQATRAEVAAHRAARFARLGGGTAVADLCCGVGADLIALARAGMRVTGVERDPLTAAVARANVRALGLAAEIREADAEGFEAAWLAAGDGGAYGSGSSGGAGGAHGSGGAGGAEGPGGAGLGAGDFAVFCDPARRPSGGPRGAGGRGRRIFDPEAYAPPLSRALELAVRGRGGCVKVAPGIPHELVPEGAEAEWVSWRGDVKEAALWLGELANLGDPSVRAGAAGERGGADGGRVRRRATLLPSGATLVDEPGLGAPPVAEVGRYLYEPDGAVIRAHLVAEVVAGLRGALIDPEIAYITSDTLVGTPFARAYEVEGVLPFSVKRLRAALRQRRVGTLTIKKRGSAVDVDRLRADLRPSGPETATVVLTRLGTRPYAFLCRLIGN